MLSKKENKIIQEYIHDINEEIPDKINSVILFGSKARKDDHKESDIDLLIIREDKPKNVYDDVWEKIISLSGEMTIKYGKDISPKIEYKKDFYNNSTSFLSRIKKEGKFLWKKKSL